MIIVVRDKMCGNIITLVATVQDGLNLIDEYEEEDRRDGTYTEDFYEVAVLDD